MKASVYIAASLDGFIARKNGDLDWLPGSGDGAEDGGGDNDGDLGYRDFLASVDVLVMGRHSFEKSAFVRTVALPEQIRCRPQQQAGRDSRRNRRDRSVAFIVTGLTRRPTRRRRRATPIRRWRQNDSGLPSRRLIQQLIITTIPVLIGDGIPLFGRLESDVTLRRLATTAFPNGFVQSRYEVRG